MSDTSTEHVTPAAPEPDAPVDLVVTPLSDILDRGHDLAPRDTGGQPDVAVAPTDQPAETGDTSARPRDEQGRFAPRAAPPTAEPDAAPEKPEPGHVPIAALRDERIKRQELERRLAEYEAARQPQQPPPQQPQQQRQIPNPAVDPAGYHAYVQHEIWQATKSLELAQSERAARAKYADIDEKLAVFQAARATNPAYEAELARQPDPWDWMHKEASRLQLMQQLGDDPAKGFDAEVERRVAERMKQTHLSSGTPSLPNLPTSLASARGVGDRASSPPTGPRPLSEIVRCKG